MDKKSLFIGLLAKTLAELPNHTEAAILILLQEHVGPLVDDSETLAGTRDELRTIQDLNDRAEAVLDAVATKFASGKDAFIYTSQIDDVWSLLRGVREAKGRQKPSL